MGWQTLKEFIEKLEDKAMIEAKPRLEGKRLSIQFAPIAKGKQTPGQLMESLGDMPKAPPRPQGGMPFRPRR